MPLSAKEKMQLFAPDEEIFAAFSDVFSAMGISRSDISAEMYDWELPDLPPSEREKLGSSEGLLMSKAVMAGLEVAQPGGAMLYKGRPVLVYLRDQMLKRLNYDNGWYNPFHVCYCQALRDAKAQHRYENRYVLTYDTSGDFLVNLNINDKTAAGKVVFQAREQGVYRRLNVCQSCLYELNWKGFRKYTAHGIKWYEGGDKQKRRQMARTFSIKEFLQSVRKLQFQPLEIEGISAVAGTAVKKYTLTAEMKRQIKDSVNNICECCHKQSADLEIHHKNHNQGDNRRENLMVICRSCHDLIHAQEGGLRNDHTDEVTDLAYGDANKNMGDMYRCGLGVKANPNKAAKHYGMAAEGYEAAAEAGKAEAGMKLGQMMVEGLVKDADEKTAGQFFQKSAAKFMAESKAGSPQACYALFIMHQNGWGCSKNPSTAEQYRQRAYEIYMQTPDKWGADDCVRISQLALDEADREAWKARAAFQYGVLAERGNAESGFKQAMLIENEKSDEDEIELPDTSSAFAAASKAFEAVNAAYEDSQSFDKVSEKARQGNEQAMQKVASMYLQGEKQGLDILKKLAVEGNKPALQAVEKCAEAGDVEAIMAMGDIYMSRH